MNLNNGNETKLLQKRAQSSKVKQNHTGYVQI